MTHNEKIDMAISYIDDEIMDIEQNMRVLWPFPPVLGQLIGTGKQVRKLLNQKEALIYAIKVLDGAKEKL